MAMLTVRNIPDDVHRTLRVRAAKPGHSMEAEVRAGVALLAAGKRQAALQDSLKTRVLPLFAGRVLPFDWGCTPAHAALIARARAAGVAAINPWLA